MSKQKHRIVLIGGTGMVGRALQNKLILQKTNFVLVGRDVVDYKFLESKIKSNDIVYYLASENKSNRRTDFNRVNVIGVKNIVQICRKVKINKLIYVSTTMVFDKNGQIRKSRSGNFYIDSKVLGLKYVKNNLDNNFYIVYPALVLYRDFRYKKEVVTTVDKIKNYLGFFTQGGLMMMLGSKERCFKYIYIDELVELLTNFDDRDNELMAVSGEISVGQYVNRASLTTRFWPFRLSENFLKIINLVISNKIRLE